VPRTCAAKARCSGRSTLRVGAGLRVALWPVSRPRHLADRRSPKSTATSLTAFRGCRAANGLIQMARDVAVRTVDIGKMDGRLKTRVLDGYASSQGNWHRASPEDFYEASIDSRRTVSYDAPVVCKQNLREPAMRIFTVLSLCLFGCAAFAQATSSLTLYVAPNGNDAWTGA